MLTLYHAPRSRSGRILWLLEELGAEYQVVYVDIRRGDGSGAMDPANPHPHKQVPALVHDGVLVTESIAIVQYLTEIYPQGGLAPLPGDPTRGPFLTWLAYYAGVVEPLATAKWTKQTDANPTLADAYDTMFHNLDDTLKAGPWLLGGKFSAADMLYLSALQFARSLLPESEVLDDYVARGSQRPALARAQAKDAKP